MPESDSTLERVSTCVVISAMGSIERTWVPAPRATHLVLDDKMFWSDPDRRFIILVKHHRFVKSIVKPVAERPPPADLVQDGFATFVRLDRAYIDFLERRTNEAYEAGFDRFDEWQMLLKSRPGRIVPAASEDLSSDGT